MLTLDPQRAAPLAVVMAIQPVVQACPQMKTRLAQHLDLKLALAAVGQGEPDLAPQQAFVARVELEPGVKTAQPLAPPVGKLKTALHFLVLPALACIQQVILVEAVMAAIGIAKQQRVPDRQNFGRVRIIKLEPQDHETALRSIHRDDNNRFWRLPNIVGIRRN